MTWALQLPSNRDVAGEPASADRVHRVTHNGVEPMLVRHTNCMLKDVEILYKGFGNHK
jgi:hypothetical protein